MQNSTKSFEQNQFITINRPITPQEMGETIFAAMDKLCTLQAFLDAIVFITDDDCSKNGYTLNVLASESAALCAAAKEMLDIVELRDCQENHLSNLAISNDTSNKGAA